MTEHRRQNIKKSLISQHRSETAYQPIYAFARAHMRGKRCKPCDAAMRSEKPGDSAAMRCDDIAGTSAMPEVFIITVRALASPIPTAVRLRRFLKIALRAFALKCIDIQPKETL